MPSRWLRLVAALLAAAFSALPAVAAAVEHPLPQPTWRVGVLQTPKRLNPVGLLGSAEASSWNNIMTEGWFLPLAGPMGSRGDYVPLAATFVPAQNMMKRERLPGSLLRHVTAVVPIRRDLSWSDGTQLTAEDVAFTYNTLLALDVAALGGNWPAMLPKDLLLQVDVVDRHTVKFWLTRLPGLGEWQFGLLSVPLLQKSAWQSNEATVWDDHNPAETFARLPMPSSTLGPRRPAGPNEPGMSRPNLDDVRLYERIVSFEAGEAAVFNSRSHFEYQSPESGGDILHVVQQEEPLAPLSFTSFSSLFQARQALAQGHIDLMLDPVQGPWPPGSEGLRLVGFNLRRPHSADLALRSALNSLIKPADVIDHIPKNNDFKATPAYSVVPVSHVGWHNPFVGFTGPPVSSEHQVMRAHRLLRSAGYRQMGGRLSDASGQPIGPWTIVSPEETTDPSAYAVADYLQRKLALLGIPAEIHAEDRESYYTRVFVERDFDLVVMGWRLRGNTFPHQLTLLFGPGASQWNVTGYESKEYEQGVTRLLQSTTLDEAQQASFDLQQLIRRDVPVIPLFTLSGGGAPTEGPVLWPSLIPRHNTVWMD